MTGYRKKILCLHGGGQSTENFKYLLNDYIEKLNSDYEFIFASSPLDNKLWYKDPPNGKEIGTSDANWANFSYNYLSKLISNNEYYGLFAFSQGVAMALVYFAKNKLNTTFKKIILCNGYLPTTHKGLMQIIESNILNNVKDKEILVTIDKKDPFYCEGLKLKQYFSNYIELKDNTEGHIIPTGKTDVFTKIITFINETNKMIKRKYPLHWGNEPEIQTKDYRLLYGGYGYGSSTLNSWIKENMQNDVLSECSKNNDLDKNDVLCECSKNNDLDKNDIENKNLDKTIMNTVLTNNKNIKDNIVKFFKKNKTQIKKLIKKMSKNKKIKNSEKLIKDLKKIKANNNNIKNEINNIDT